MVGMVDPEREAIIKSRRENVLKLMENKTRIEAEIRDNQRVLEENGIGMNEPLVDTEGFPRNDINVYGVRLARHSIICLTNDLKGVMKAIEDSLHQLHAVAGNSSSDLNSTAHTLTDERNKLEPFAVVKDVLRDSPAFISGLQTDDHVIEFGSVNCDNFKSVEDIARVVRHSVNSTVHLLIQRGNQKLPLQLNPRQWSGRGLLGCTILPSTTLKNDVDR